MIVIACPGQGSQTPGFLNEWLELPNAREFMQAAGDAAEVDLIAHGTTSDADVIRDTKIAQPLIVSASILAWNALSARADLSAAGVAGHSVGEFAAASVAGGWSRAWEAAGGSARQASSSGAARCRKVCVDKAWFLLGTNPEPSPPAPRGDRGDGHGRHGLQRAWAQLPCTVTVPGSCT